MKKHFVGNHSAPHPTQAAIRRAIDVGPRIGQVSPVGYWYRAGHFSSDDEAQGAFELAWQQFMDGCGVSAEEWMGLTTAEVNAWHRDGTLPARDNA